MIADIGPALVAFLYADAAISTVVGGGLTKQQGGRRIYPGRLLQGQKAASIVYSRVSGQGDHHMEGPSGLARPRVQIDCWATTYDAAQALANLVKERIDGYRGIMSYGTSPIVVVQVQGVFFESEREDYDAAADMHRASRDYFVWFAER